MSKKVRQKKKKNKKVLSNVGRIKKDKNGFLVLDRTCYTCKWRVDNECGEEVIDDIKSHTCKEWDMTFGYYKKIINEASPKQRLAYREGCIDFEDLLDVLEGRF